MEKLRYLYQDQEIFAVEKPPGTHSVRLATGGGRSIADLLLEERPELSQVGAPKIDAGLVMRLDLHTSGILLGAKTASMWSILRDMIARGALDKRYTAYLEGHITTTTTVTTFIGSPHRGAKKMKVYQSEPPKSARALQGTTTFVPLAYDEDRDLTTVEAHASPARRHQIRIHARHIGHPLVGDSLYGSTRTLSQELAQHRDFMLHASYLAFDHPISGERVAVASDACVG